jgi:hypothetical protein
VRGRVGHGDGRKAGGGTLLKGGGGNATKGESGNMCRGTRRERGGLGVAENGSGGRHWPPAGERGWRRCRVTMAGSRTRVTRARAADRRDRVTAGPGG